MPAPKDYYKILEVDEKADAKAIKSAYHRLARKYHPDVGGKGNEERFKSINEAYQILSDPKKRQEYDRMRFGYANREARRQGPGYRRVNRDWAGSGPDDFSSIFEDLFGGNFSTEPPGPSRTVPEETVSVSLEQVLKGGTVNISISQMTICPVCQGTNPDCARCGGLGSVMEPKKYTVTIPPGVEDGAVLRVGEMARLRVHVAPHPRFVRQGTTLRGRLMVSAPLAAVGGEVPIRTLAGDEVMVRIPPHTDTGKVLRLKGMGLPRRGGGEKGDLLLEITLFLPQPLTDQEERLYRELLPLHTERGGEIHAPR